MAIFFEGMSQYFGGIEGIKSQMSFFFSTNRRAGECAPWFKARDFTDIVAKIVPTMETLKEGWRKELFLDARQLLDLKDESGLTDDGLRVWRKKFGQFFASESDLVRHLRNQFSLFQNILQPYSTQTGYAVNVHRLYQLIKYTTPEIFLYEEQNIIGINFDATKTGGQPLTSGTIRLLNPSLLYHQYKMCSPNEEWKFALYFGKDSSRELKSNIFYNESNGSFFFPTLFQIQTLRYYKNKK